MRRILCIIVVAIISFLISGCGYKEVQLAYYTTVQKQLELAHVERATRAPLVDIKTPDGYTIVVANPYQSESKLIIQKPDSHPAYSVVGTLLNNPVASILAGGYAGKLLLQEAGTTISGSYNQGSAIGMDKGTAALDASNYSSVTTNTNDSVNDSNNQDNDTHDNSTHNAWSDSYNQDNDIVDSYDPVDNSNNEQWSDSHDSAVTSPVEQ